MYLESTNLKTGRPTKKLDNKRFGPFKVKRKVGAASYELTIPANWPGIHPVFHESYLTPFRPPKFTSQQRPPPPPPIEIQGEPEYEIEEILESRTRRGKKQYLVHWKGYPREEDSWVPAVNVKNAAALDRFLQQNRSRIIRAIELHPEDARLFDTNDGTPGNEFYPIALPTPTDAVIPLRPSEMEKLVKRQPIFLPNLPGHIKRIWIHETGNVRATTFVVSLTEDHQLLRLYQLLNPLRVRDYRGKYDVYAPRRPSNAPPWLRRDYAKHLLRVW